MLDPAVASSMIRFGVFEVDLRSGELRKHSLKVRIQKQPFRVLAMLLEHQGQIVTREELHKELWPADTFVDFEHGLNAAINRLREALGDSADNPRFVETLHGHGYRFIAPISAPSPSSTGGGAAQNSPPYPQEGQGAIPVSAAGRESSAVGGVREPHLRKRWIVVSAAGGALAVLAVLLAFDVGGPGRLFWRATGALHEQPMRVQSIAVLPLENLSGDPQQEYFADGMTEELITNLGKIGALRVISRTSVMRYKGTKKALPDIARELNVDALVEGTVSRSGNRVRITANLLQAQTDRHLWAESYERDLHDVLSLQDEVAQTIAQEIKIQVTPQEQARLAAAHRVNPQAYELYLKGRYHYYKWAPEEFRTAVEYFQKAIQADPGWAPPYAGLATSYGWLWIDGALSPEEALPRFEAALKTALAIDDMNPEVRYTLAASAYYYRWDWEEADREFQRALVLDPNLVEARFEYAWYLSDMGRLPEALAEAQRALDRDPLSVSANLAMGDIYFRARQYDKALSQIQRIAVLEPGDFRAPEFLAVIYEQQQMYGEAIAERKILMRLRGVPAESISSLERAYQQAGAEGYWNWQLAEAKRHNAPYAIARAYARLGQASQAVAWLEKSYQQHDWEMVQLQTVPAWDPIRSDPRFQALLRRMNFPP
ncbi:MAG: winged helix-turn-helix domain-containing protein [Terriglobia bacterium]|jgi:TolB-like protein/DNA-binding winged helix-turn-helix (wHTH) protein/thioredoxin-like negative regulator of GroEL